MRAYRAKASTVVEVVDAPGQTASRDAARALADSPLADSPLADSSPIRVLFVTDYLLAGGIESQLTDLLLRLDRQRIEPHVLCIYGRRPENLHFAAQLREADIPMTALPFDLTRRDQVRAARQIIAHAWRLRPHIIQPEGYHANLLTRLTRPFLPATRLLGTIRGMESAKQLLYERMSHWTCAAMVASGPQLRDDLTRRAHLPPAKVRVIANGINVARFAIPHDVQASVATRARALPEAGAGRLVVSVGRVSKQKRLPLLVAALGRLRREGRLPATAHLLIVGAAQDTVEQARLAAAIARENVAPWITQLGATPHPEDAYHAADASVLFTILEGISCAMLESLAAGRPVLISQEANRAGVIEDGRTGWVVPTHDVGALADALARVFALPDAELAEMRAACRARASQYDIAPLVTAYSNLYLTLTPTKSESTAGAQAVTGAPADDIAPAVCPSPQPSGEPSRQVPFVSIVVPAYNAASSINRCLAPLLAQTYPRDRYEIILADDGSTDGLADVARACLAGGSIAFQVLTKANGGPASARNAGIRAATGEIVAFTDADCVAEPNWIAALVRALDSSNAVGVGGPIVNATTGGWVDGYLESGGVFRHRVRRGVVDYLLTGNVAFRRSALEEIGWFTERAGAWGEDADLSFRLRQRGYALLLSHDGAVTHYGTPASVARLAHELFRYGRGNVVLSGAWPRVRHPAVELARHSGAVVLSFWLALARARRVGVPRAITYWPLVIVEHGAFVAGMLSGLARRLATGGEQRG